MNDHDKQMPGHFEIAKEPADISFDKFWNEYFIPERPFIIENIGADWPALKRWNETYLLARLAKENQAKAASLWYWMEKDCLNDEYTTPAIIDKTLAAKKTVFWRTRAMRVWIHGKNNLSSWHYDANMVSVFNIQVTGRKKWSLISPETPIDYYPFTNFGILDSQGNNIFQDKIHTCFELNAGDMLFLPPLWIHQVEACEDENISLNWLVTKKQTQVVSKTLQRDLERYSISEYFAKHPRPAIQKLHRKINAILPGYLVIGWRFPKLIKTPYLPSATHLLSRVAKELLSLSLVIKNIRHIGPYLKKVKSAKNLEMY